MALYVIGCRVVRRVTSNVCLAGQLIYANVVESHNRGEGELFEIDWEGTSAGATKARGKGKELGLKLSESPRFMTMYMGCRRLVSLCSPIRASPLDLSWYKSL